MPKYTPSFIDYGAVAKVYTDELYRNAQMQIKRNDILDKRFDTEYKMYSGKLRKQDLAEFDSKFAQYQMAAKGYQKANRGNGFNVSGASASVGDARNAMLGYVQESAKLGEYGKNLSKYRTEAKNLIDRDLLDATLMDASTMTTDEFKTKYESIEKAPSPADLVWQPKKFNVPQYHQDISKTLFFKPSSSLNIMPAFDDKGLPKTMGFTFNVNGVDKTYQVPVMSVMANPNADEVLSKVSATSYDYNTDNFLKWNKDQIMADSQDQTNPAVATQAGKVLGFAAKIYKTDVASLTPQQIYAASFINPDRPSSFEVPDFKYLNQQMKAEMFELNKKKANKALEKLQKDINQSQSEFGIKTAQKYVGLYKGLQEIGATSNEEWMSQFGPIFESVGIPVDQNTRMSLYNNAIGEKLNQQYGPSSPSNPNQPETPYSPGGKQPRLLPKK